MLALKHLNFSLAEIRHMTMADFIAYTDLAYGESKTPDVREATQADIDAFLG